VTLRVSCPPGVDDIGGPVLEEAPVLRGRPRRTHSTSAGIGTATVGTMSHSHSPIGVEQLSGDLADLWFEQAGALGRARFRSAPS
jgi:hypothetical protein